MEISRRSFVFRTSLSAGAALVAPGLVAATAKKPAPGAAAADLHDWNAVRGLFNLDPAWTHASLFFIASHPKPVREAIESYRNKLDRDPFTTVEDGMFSNGPENMQERLWVTIGNFIGADPLDVAITPNTTGGLALLYNGLQLRPGDEILTTEHDHVVHHTSIDFAVRRTGASTRRIQLFTPHDASGATAEGIVSKIRESVSPATRVLGITWVHSSSGVKLPLKAIAAAVAELNATRPEAERVMIFVDGVHGMGVADREIAKLGVDAFAAGLHKWMFGPRGTGFVWAKPEVWARLRPSVPSFSAEELYDAWKENREPKGPPRAAWFSPGGFHSFEHQWGLLAAFDLHDRIGHDRIVKRVADLNGLAKKELATMKHVRLRTPMSPDLSAGVIAFDIDGIGGEEVVKHLREKKIIASTSPYAISYPRISFGIANNERDVERCVEAIRGMRV